MATLFLSQHSSNPLDVGSSDPRNRAYRHQYMEAQGTRDRLISSDDPIHGYQRPELEEYHNHLEQVLGVSLTSKRPTNNVAQGYVDLDEDMPSDDELDLVGKIQEDGEEHIEEGEEIDLEDADTDEDMTLYLKSPEEQQEIQDEIESLEAAVPQLTEDYKIVDRLGTGTFSSVYKAADLGYHDKWDNTPWHGHHPASSSAHYQSTPRPHNSKVYVAIKRIYVTSNPERIRNEIAIMEDCRGCRHVSQLITAFRHEDQVVAIMPYHRNEDFRDFYRTLSMAGIKTYFRCMFRALRDIHARSMIHRDVKPANFLFDPRTGSGTLCDFGLACRMNDTQGACLHSSATREYPHGQILGSNAYDREFIKKMQKEARQKSSWTSDKVGYPDKDTRPQSKANRAGTRGFRAPEVLLKCGQQTGAIDVWSAGMILLFFLTGKFPLFQSNDDVEALVEIATIIGKKKMEKTATLHSRTFATNLPTIIPDGLSWRSFVEKLNPTIYTPPDPDAQLNAHIPFTSTLQTQSYINSHLPPPSSSSSPSQFRSQSLSPRGSSPAPISPASTYLADLECAFDLLEQLLMPESVHRITPRGALYHPFLADPEEPEDDEFFPHPFGEGVCGEWHFRDDVTEEPCVKVNLVGAACEVKRLVAGEGVAIGRQPCEYHREEYGC